MIYPQRDQLAFKWLLEGPVSALQTFSGWTFAAGLPLLIAIFCLASAARARATEQRPETPQLELTSPFSGTPKSLDGSATGEFLITTTSSGILTLWSRFSQNSWQRQVIHPPPRHEYATGGYYGAISPDGDTIAFAVPPLSDVNGGYQRDTARIYIIDRASLQLITFFSAGISTRITGLRFSPDGRRLGAVLAGGCGVRIWTHRQWTNSARDQEPDFSDDDGYGGADGVSACCAGADTSACEAFPKGTDVLFTGLTGDSSPWLITLSETGLRTYTFSNDRPRRAESGLLTPKDMRLERPGRMALSPDQTMLAVGDSLRSQVAILGRVGVRFQWSTFPKWRTNLNPDRFLSAYGKDNEDKFFVTDPVWARSGGRLLLYAFGYLPSGAFADAPKDSRANRIAIFDREDSRIRFVPLGNDIDTSSRAYQSAQSPGSIVFVSPNALSMIDVGVQSPRVIAGRTALDLRSEENDYVLRLNRHDKSIYLSSPAGDSAAVAIEFDYSEMRIVGEARPLASLDNVRTDEKGHDAEQGYYDAEKDDKQWRFNEKIIDKSGNPPGPTFFGKPLSLKNLDSDEFSYSGAKAPERDIVVWGTDRALRIVAADATVACSRPINSPAYRMNITADGRMVVVGHGDGAIKFYRLGDDPKERCLPLVASLYLTRNEDGTWGFLAWLPNGKFMTAGGAALKDLACYPVGGPDGLGRCIPFQETDGFFSPDEVKRALDEADSTEEAQQQLVDVVTAKAQAITAAVHLEPSKYDIAVSKLPITVTTTGLGDIPLYLSLVSNGSDVPFMVDDTRYSRDNPYPVNGRQTLDLVADLPLKVQHKDVHFLMCPILTSLRDAGADATRRLKLSTDPCKSLLWSGTTNAPPTNRKLWALLIGFSRGPRDGVPGLDFAHEDAINFARFLQRDSQGDLPGKSRFDEIDVKLLVAADGLDWSALIQDAEIRTLLGKNDGRFHLVPTPSRGEYAGTVKKLLKDITDTIATRRDKADWDDEILVYFSGHGFLSTDASNHKYSQFELVTPDVNAELTLGTIDVKDDLVDKLAKLDSVSMVIIDACSAKIYPYASQQVQLEIVRDWPGDGQVQFYLGSQLGGYAYEQRDYAVDDFVPGFTLWPAGWEEKAAVCSAWRCLPPCCVGRLKKITNIHSTLRTTFCETISSNRRTRNGIRISVRSWSG